MRRYSTGALTPSHREEQEKLYKENHVYDYVIVGSGMSALSVSALLANAGYKVCILEVHDVAGGYAHTYSMNGYSFCAQVHYIWGCAPGQMVYEFLKHLELEKEIKFVPFDPDGYDHMTLPDGKTVKIPYGYRKLIDNIESAYPGQRSSLQRFISLLEEFEREIQLIPKDSLHWWQKMQGALKCLTLLRSRYKTLQNVFEECKLSREAQAILSANTGDFMSPPEELSIFPYVGLFSGYNKGAYYPEKHFKFFVDRLTEFITDHDGCHIYYETEVTGIHLAKDRIEKVSCRNGKEFKADKFICNMDPQKASHLIGRDKFPKKTLHSVSYKYSPSSLMIYLGIKDIDLRDYGFGNHNTWHLEQWNINQAWKEMRNNCYDQPWLFLSTPTFHTPVGGVAPDGCQILEIGTLANFEFFEKLYNEDPHAYRVEKRELSNRLLKIVEEKYIPDLSKHIALKVIGSPVTNETFCFAPFGNCYGSELTPEYMGLDRLASETPWDNFFWCNASSGYASVFGTITTGSRLYSKLTGDQFYLPENAPSTEEAINYANRLWNETWQQKSSLV
jgi:phytoene dehydrogenase-like protein